MRATVARLSACQRYNSPACVPNRMSDAVTIERRFRGPSESGQGGYSCGLLARAIGAPAVEVTLRAPPPLDVELELVGADDGVRLIREGRLIGEATALSELELDLPAPVSHEVAAAAADASPLHEHHAAPECFVCGPLREPGDGLQVLLGEVAGRALVASPCRFDASLPNHHGKLPTEIVWAVLDCPSGWASLLVPEVGTSVLGRMAARVLDEPEVGRGYVAVGWPLAHEGRKFDAGSALFALEGQPLAYARARWIELR